MRNLQCHLHRLQRKCQRKHTVYKLNPLAGVISSIDPFRRL